MLFASMQLMAGNVNVDAARQTAIDFMAGKAAHGRMMATSPKVQWIHQEMNSSNVQQAAYYIVNTDAGFVIVAGDDRAQSILAYGDAPLASNNLSSLPENMRFWLNYYKQQMEFLQARPGMVVEKPSFNMTRSTSVEPLLTAKWDQGYPYYSQCPMDGDRRALTGCACTSLAQVFYRWQYPTEPTPVIPGYTTTTRGFELDELPSVTFDWDNLLPEYKIGSYTQNDDHHKAIAQLMRYIGQAERMDYCNDGSTAWEDDILRACETFGYEEAYVTYKSVMNFDTGVETTYINDEDWSALLQSELVAGRPIVFCAYDYNAGHNAYGGHAFNVDGYKAEDGTFHINWGWSGQANGYFALNAFKYQNATYHLGQLAVMNIKPATTVVPTIKVNPATLNLQAVAGETATATFTVKGKLLDDAITLTLNDADGVFGLDITTLNVAEAQNENVITVAYAPVVEGTSTATITISSPGAEDKVVTLNGTAIPAPLVVYDPIMLPADSAYINLTSFRADWTDQTAPENVDSYALEVSTKPNFTVLADVDWSNTAEVFSNQAGNWAASGLIPEGWSFSGSQLWAEDHFMSFQSASITTCEFSTGSDKMTAVFTAKSLYGLTSITVATSQASQTIALPGSFTQMVVVLDCAQADQVTFTAGSSYIGMLKATIYAGEVSAPEMRAVHEEGDAAYRLITGITDRFYTVNNLNAEGSYVYKVKALYKDGTESEWSNVEQVTLFENGPAPQEYELGDVDHNHFVNVADVTALIQYILTSGAQPEEFYVDLANVDGDEAGLINVADVTALIAKILNQ